MMNIISLLADYMSVTSPTCSFDPWTGSNVPQTNPAPSQDNMIENGAYIAIDNEVMKIVDSPGVSNEYIVQRGAYGTNITTHNVGAIIRFVDTKQTAIQLDPGPVIDIFELDATSIGYTGGPLQFVSGFQTSRSVTELIDIYSSRDMTNTSFWTSTGAVAVTGNLTGPDGMPSAFELIAPAVNDRFYTTVTVPNDSSTYHFRLTVRPRNDIIIFAKFHRGMNIQWGALISPDGIVQQPDTGFQLPNNISTIPLQDGYILIDFDAFNNSEGNIELDFGVEPMAPGAFPAPGYTLAYNPQIFAPAGMVSWSGNLITAVPVQTSGFEVSTRGALPTPHIKVSNVIVGNAFAVLVDALNDLIGAKITRYRVFAKNLDTGIEPDGLKFFRPDIYTVSRKISQNKLYIEWELQSAIDQEGVLLPSRTILADYCQWQYRTLTATGNFDYSNVDCPYVMDTYFDQFDNQTDDPAKDVCSKHITGCKLRFNLQPGFEHSSGTWLPFAGFPGCTKWGSG